MDDRIHRLMKRIVTQSARSCGRHSSCRARLFVPEMASWQTSRGDNKQPAVLPPAAQEQGAIDTRSIPSPLFHGTHQEQRSIRGMEHARSNAAVEDAPQPGAAMAGHGDQVYILPIGNRQN